MLELLAVADDIKCNNEELRKLSFQLGPSKRKQIGALTSHNQACIWVIKSTLMDELDKL